MPQFARRTILAATDFVAGMGHSGVDRLLLEHGLEDAGMIGSLRDRATALARYLLQEPDRLDDEGRCLTDVIVADLIERAMDQCTKGYPREFDFELFQATFPALQRALDRDGFTVQYGVLRRALPQTLDLPRADDEVHGLLENFGFSTPKGHLDQAIAAHSRGDWAAANAQLRAFVESLFDHAAERLADGAALPPGGHLRQQWLAKTNPPFFLPSLNEWNDQATGFLQGFYRRLHPQGAHPGLSDDDDSTFRLHLVLLVARLCLRRLGQRTG